MTTTTNARAGTSPSPRPWLRPSVGRVMLAATLLVAGAVHVFVVREHLDEWPPAGIYFAVLAIVQCASAVWVAVRWDRGVATVVVVVSLTTVVTWLVSRTTGLPVGPAEMREPEPVGALDLVCCAAELIAVAVCAACWPVRHSSRRTG